MRILVDENIPLARELFGSLGEIELVAGRDVDEHYPGLDRFDALAIRSVTKVTPALVDRAVKARAVATATIGTDHIDTAYIERANARRECPIAVFSAPGSNAESVADYVFYALAHLTRGATRALSEMSLGIIGHGNCGRRVARRAAAFGMKVLRHDPPLAERDVDFASDGLEETLSADFVTLHVPLTREGESAHPTHHMIGARELAVMKPEATLINSSRGGVVDSAALVEALRTGAIACSVLDVFEGEPEPRGELIDLPALATPHIAGYAVEAKRRGAVVICEQLCRLFGREPEPMAPLLMRGFAAPGGERVRVARLGRTDVDADAAVRALLAETYDIEATSRELKATLGAEGRGALFDAMRRDYERDYARRELASYTVRFDQSVPGDLRAAIEVRLAGFGTRVKGQDAHFLLAAE